MSIFTLNPFDDGIVTEDKLKEDVLDFFHSNFVAVDFHTDSGYNCGSCYAITIEELTDYFIIKNKIPLLLKHLELLSIYLLLEVFLNIFNNYHELINSYIEDNNECGTNCRYTNYVINEFNNNLYSYIISFLKYKNIEINNSKKNIYTLNFNSPILLEKSSYEIRKTINSYLKIKKNITESSLVDKQNLMAGLKNYLGRFFDNKNFIENTSFINMNISETKKYWQSLFSHKDNQDNNEKHIKIKARWENEMKLFEKHKLIDEVFDCAVYINYKINTK